MSTETDDQPTAPSDSFATCLKRVRTRIRAKQYWLAHEVGCTEAAVSHWENGTRLPREGTMRRVFQALERGGALPAELVALLVAWRSDIDNRLRSTLRATTQRFMTILI